MAGTKVIKQPRLLALITKSSLLMGSFKHAAEGMRWLSLSFNTFQNP